MDNRSLRRARSFGISDVALQWVMSYIDDPLDRSTISLVCKKWHDIDALTRKQVTIALCYATTPARLRSRFPNLEFLKLKGKPRAAMFNLIPEKWGGYARPWIREIAESFHCLKFVHFRRMIVTDEDINLLVRGRGHMLQSLKLDKCSGFSTEGLSQVARSCRIMSNGFPTVRDTRLLDFRLLRILVLEESSISDKGSTWLRELAQNNVVLEVLNFYLTYLVVDTRDLELLASNCLSLISLKVSDCEILDLRGFFREAAALQEFGGGSFNNQAGEVNKYENVHVPPRLFVLSLMFMCNSELPVIHPCAPALKMLDLQFAMLDTEGHCQLIQHCPNLEVLEVRNVIGDRGLGIVAKHCKKLRRLRIERGDDEQGLEDEQGMVSQNGISVLAQGCLQLEYMAVYVSDISNEALECIGTYCKKLYDFRLVLLDREEGITDLPLDNGVRALLRGCQKLRRFALYLRHGGLTDVGLDYIGKYSNNIRWMLLGFVGETDSGFLEFCKGCPSLVKLEMRGCLFSERALAVGLMQLASLRYIWVQGYRASTGGRDLLLMNRPFWNIEIIPPNQQTDQNGRPVEDGAELYGQMLAYYSLAGRRTDYCDTVVPLSPS